MKAPFYGAFAFYIRGTSDGVLTQGQFCTADRQNASAGILGKLRPSHGESGLAAISGDHGTESDVHAVGTF